MVQPQRLLYSKIRIMKKLKQAAKRIIPDFALRGVANSFHLAEAVAANVRYGFPSRPMQVIMVTGTNGKTTTATFLGSILRKAGKKTGVLTTAHFEINGQRFDNDQNATVLHPMTLQSKLAEMRKHGVDTLVLEVTSHAIEQHRIWGIPVHVAIMTNLTQDHLDYHGTMENYAAAKARLFQRRPKFIVLNHDDEWFNYYDQFPPGEQSITYGTHMDADVQLQGAKLHREGTQAHLSIDHQTEMELVLRLPGKFNVYNAMAATAAAYLMHIKTEVIQDGIEAVQGIAGRQQRVDAGQNFEIVVDYAHTPDALEQLLSTLKATSKRGRVILVFGACGDRDKGKRPVMGEVAAEFADKIYVTDEESYNEDPAAIRDMIMKGIKNAKAEDKTVEIADRREAIAAALKEAHRADTVVITGMGHEQFRIVNGERLPWNDAKVVEEILAE